MASTRPQDGVPVLRRRPVKALSQKLSSRFHWFLDVPPERLDNMTQAEASEGTIDAIENGTNDFIVVLVAATGFFTDSYILFATNTILPMLNYVYWNEAPNPDQLRYNMSIKCASLAGVFAGMICFGYLADKFGRQRLYGIVLLTLIAGTIGLVTSSPGFTWTHPELSDEQGRSSMNVVVMLIIWRFISGLGIGGDYPLSSVMVSEMAPTKKRARMLAWLFSMQAFGFATATVVSIVVVKVVRHFNPEPSQVAVDQIWRWIVGLSLIPASIAVALRLFVPESPRFTLYVLNYPFRALQDADTLNQAGIQDRHQTNYADKLIQEYKTGGKTSQNDSSRPLFEQTGYYEASSMPTQACRDNISIKSFWQYLRNSGNGWKLAVTSSTWFLLDITFFGLDFRSAQTTFTLWDGSACTANQTTFPLWDTKCSNWNSTIAMFNSNGIANSSYDTAQIYTILLEENTQSLCTYSIGAILGSVCLILAIERFNRKKLQWMGFGILGVLLIVIGAIYKNWGPADFQGAVTRGVVITLYVIAHFFFSFGPNALTFIISSELFPTKFRCTCQGISAAAGKLGSIIAQIILTYPPGSCNHAGGWCNFNSPNALWYVLIIFAVLMLLGGGITWKWLPELQQTSGPHRYESIALEQLAEEDDRSLVRRRPLHEA